MQCRKEQNRLHRGRQKNTRLSWRLWRSRVSKLQTILFCLENQKTFCTVWRNQSKQHKINPHRNCTIRSLEKMLTETFFEKHSFRHRTCLPNTRVCPTASSPKAQTFEPLLYTYFDLKQWAVCLIFFAVIKVAVFTLNFGSWPVSQKKLDKYLFCKFISTVSEISKWKPHKKCEVPAI